MDFISRGSGSLSRHLISPLIAVLVAFLPGTAGAISLQQYFFELTDRERGAYVTGFLDFFGRDTARDAGYKQCIEQLGPGRLNEALADLVRSEPAFLSYDAMSWLLYEGSRLCNQKPPRDLPRPPAPSVEPKAPPVEAVTALPPANAATTTATAIGKVRWRTSTILLVIAAMVCVTAGVFLLYRCRKGAAPFRLLRRPDPKQSAHSPG